MQKLLLLIVVVQLCLFLADAVYKINISQRVDKLEEVVLPENCVEIEK